MFSRRQINHAMLLAPLAGLLAGTARADGQSTLERLKRLERDSGGRLGVAVLDTGDGRRFGLREDERFPLCSTFKLLLAACILARVDRGEEQLARRIVYSQADLVEYSPASERHVGQPGMSVAELCEAAITLSDNGAANLLLASLGGPTGLTDWLRSTGDGVSRLDRNEPTLNQALPGDPRDTSTPRAMVATLQRLLLGDVLQAASRDQLNAWLAANKTGDKRIRAGLPTGWKVGDKTGTGERGTSNDVAILRPPGRAPILVAAYLTGSPVPAEKRDALLAEVGRLAAGLVEQP
ncbi:class A beta-lactamase [Pseudomonas citronellolis]|uniref:class A beta-lactamase n=1 Tax=Pseudomonas citronellolis TaxID=53408 RepID=UPI000718463C|nr:class A beta-lactamase [Pseudomonas citronellolis]KRV73768.1 class A beta-lactamase [Pseudomonas citronellolis]KRW75633.1 class A beta-lactamase [Pseudomonas citronellolis]